MPSDAMGIGFWLVMLIVLGGGAIVVVGTAAMGARGVRAAAWKRTVWQAALLALLGLVLAEVVGVAPVIVAIQGSRSPPRRIGGAGCQPAGQIGNLSHGVADEETAPSLGIFYPPASRPTGLPLLLDEPVRPAGIASQDPPLTAIRTPPVVAANFISDRPPRQSPEAVWWPGLLWAAGAAAVLARIAWTRAMLFRFRRRLAPVACAEVRRAAWALARAMGLRRPPALLAARGLAAPVAFGLVRPAVVLPARFVLDYDPRQQRAMLAHELAHLAGRDPLWQLLAELACALLWWHPLVWWLRGRLRAANEAVADEASLLVPGGPELLADCLVRLGRRMVARPRLVWLSVEGGGFRSSLGQRVERLLRLPEKTHVRPPRAAMVAARVMVPVALVVASVLSTAWARPQASFEQGETTMHVVSLSWQRSLAAVALAAFLGSPSPSAVAQDRPHEPKAVAPKEEGPHKEKPPAPKHEGDHPRPEGERGDRDRPSGDRELSPHQRELMEMRAKLLQKGREIREKLEQAKPDSDDARELREALENVRREMQKVMEQLGPAGRGREGGPGPDRARMEQRLEELHRKFRELREAGKEDEAERVGREIQAIRARLAGPREGGRPDMPPQERERRMQHLRAAAENLRAAGMPEAAERLLRGAEFGPGKPMPPEGPPPPEGRGPGFEGPPREGVPPMMRELVGQVQELRRQVQELREEIHKMKEERK